MVPTSFVHIWTRRTTTFQLVRVSRAVQEHVRKAVEVWGDEWRKLYTKLTIHDHHHSLKGALLCDFMIRPFASRARPCAVECHDGS